MPDTPKRPRRILKPGPIAELAADRQKGQAANEEQLRRLVNDGQILEKATKGELRVQVLRDGHPSPPLANEPICTKSQILAYFDKNNNEVARAHQYLRTDGNLGAHGKPDPKRIVHNGIIYFLDRP